MEHPARFKLVTCGRRWGKTLLGKNAILYQALRYQKTLLVAGAHLPNGKPNLARPKKRRPTTKRRRHKRN